MTDNMDWYWRMRMGLPARSEDHEALRRLAPELFGRNVEGIREQIADEPSVGHRIFRDDVRQWLRTREDRPSVTVREGSCPQTECPLGLGRRSRHHVTQPNGVAPHGDGALVLELMTVAGGWSAKDKVFYDMARKVHGGRGPIKELLVTDPYVYADKSEEGTTGGINNFLRYLECLDISHLGVTIYQPPYARGRQATSGAVWRRTIAQHGKNKGFDVRFAFFRTRTQTRFHDRFYLARHGNGSVSGLFGPSMNGLNDESFVLVGELEEMTLKRLRACLEGWT